MKEIRRDFTVTASVPDDVETTNCEIIVNKFSASYIDPSSGRSVDVEDENMGLGAEAPYEELRG